MPAMEYESEYGIDVVNRFAGLSIETDDPLELIQRAQQKEKALKADKKQTKGVKGGAKPQEKAQVVATKETVIEDIKKEGSRIEKSDKQERGDQRGRGRGSRGGRGRGRGRGGAGGDRPPRDAQSRDHQDGLDDGDQRGSGGERRGFGDRRGGFGERRERRGGFGGERRGFGDRQGFGERKSFGNDTEGSGERKAFGNQGESVEQQEDGYGRRGGRGRPRGRARGGRGGRGREFDRHSGSDRSSVKASEKRDGSGSYNWGTPQDELEASEEANVMTPMDEEVKGSWADAAEQPDVPEDSAEAGDEESPKEDEAKEMTLDEYKTMLEKEKPSVSYNVRQANEGEKGFPKNAVTLKKLSENEEESDGSLFFPKRIIEEKIKTSGRVKEVLPFDLKYAAVDSRLTSGGGGGRGNRRGRGSRGGRGLPRKGGRDGGERGDDKGFGEKEPATVDRYDEDFPNLQ